jgi:hypothetical protein
MIETINPLEVYKSSKGIKFKVLHLGRHGQDCSIPMVVYTNIEKTSDADIGTIWVISESIFLNRFNEI